MRRYAYVFFCIVGMFYVQAVQANKERFLSLNTGLDFVLNESIGSWNISFEYGQSIISSKSYRGFYTVGATYPLDGPGYIGVNLEYGYEFRRDKTFSFGLNTFHSVGYTTSYKSSGWGFGNALGLFGRIKLTDTISVPIHIGLSHNNPFKTVVTELTNGNFGPYVHFGIRYDWL